MRQMSNLMILVVISSSACLTGLTQRREAHPSTTFWVQTSKQTLLTSATKRTLGGCRIFLIWTIWRKLQFQTIWWLAQSIPALSQLSPLLVSSMMSLQKVTSLHHRMLAWQPNGQTIRLTFSTGWMTVSRWLWLLRKTTTAMGRVAAGWKACLPKAIEPLSQI